MKADEGIKENMNETAFHFTACVTLFRIISRVAIDNDKDKDKDKDESESEESWTDAQLSTRKSNLIIHVFTIQLWYLLFQSLRHLSCDPFTKTQSFATILILSLTFTLPISLSLSVSWFLSNPLTDSLTHPTDHILTLSWRWQSIHNWYERERSVRTYMYGTLEGQSLTDVHGSVHCSTKQSREQAWYEHSCTALVIKYKVVITLSR